MKYMTDLKEDQAEALKALGLELEKVEEEEKEWPYDGAIYYVITASGVSCHYWDSDEIDEGFMSIGNAFKTKEEAEFEIECRKVWHELSKFAEGANEVWNEKDPHWYLDYNRVSDKICVHSFYQGYQGSPLYFLSENVAREAVEAVGEDRIKKYYFGNKGVHIWRSHPLRFAY